jgi:hypothetical protein
MSSYPPYPHHYPPHYGNYQGPRNPVNVYGPPPHRNPGYHYGPPPQNNQYYGAQNPNVPNYPAYPPKNEMKNNFPGYNIN